MDIEKEISVRYPDVPIARLQAMYWIPVDEKLPEKAGIKLVTARGTGGDLVTLATYNSGKWVVSRIEVIAWMDLPEPYKGGE